MTNSPRRPALGFYIAAGLVIAELAMFAFDAHLRTQDAIPYPPHEGLYAFWQGIDVLFLLWASLGALAAWRGGRWYGWLAWALYTAQAFVLGWSANAPRLGLGSPTLVAALLATTWQHQRRRLAEAIDG